MPFDFKKEYREFYLPPKTPRIVEIPEMRFVAVRGSGDPNEEDGAYKRAVGVLYAVAYTLRMSGRGGREIPGFFAYVVPPLEGLWWQEGVVGVDYANKDTFHWISLIRLPDFVSQADFDWAVSEAAGRKKLDCSGAELFTYREGLCVQCMHMGPYDDEPATIAHMNEYALQQGYVTDITPDRCHHEIYLSDPRKTGAAGLRTVIRHPVRRADV